ncbi:SDR family oxidoreductase [Haloarchaeobius sp. HME9146]|uniref:SDR family NAD(P)-dependent oxidoreductase n=1 Tax=Haloarchaeobius sp. HME9146 TaxID=2978732 RepID=UPI0021C23DE6|nr:SDR family oxidoreductase [Haloarchaeobius sp. HME9146]MCT9094478.1 SDR family oxidoreductase [Haloarchaeobius sp. HME9146]
MNRDTALVTGASSGIGRELARQFARHGHDLVLVARREDDLDAVAEELESRHGIDAASIPKDLDDEAAPQELYDEVHERDLDVGVLVNNVGIGTYGPFSESDLGREQSQLRLNVTTLVTLTRLFLDDFTARDRGKILNVGSVAGFQPGPFMAGYYASKAYVNSFTEAIAEELRDTGVNATVLCPGPVDTEFQERAGMQDSAVGSTYMQPVEDVAKAGYKGVMSGKTVVVPGLPMKLLTVIARVTPRPILRRVARRVNSDR